MSQFCSLPFAIKALENHIKRYMYHAGDAPHQPTEMQQAVIWYLGQRAGQDIFQRDLEKAFHMRRSTATGILQLMERDDLLIRKPVPHDRRLKKLCLTEKALSLHHQAVLKLTRFEELLIQGLTQEELETFNRVVAKMIANLSLT
ncbi:MAG: MarR family winged helix-turn-helix transcriptional regulator [Oscillospiraceae bacterium]